MCGHPSTNAFFVATLKLIELMFRGPNTLKNLIFGADSSDQILFRTCRHTIQIYLYHNYKVTSTTMRYVGGGHPQSRSVCETRSVVHGRDYLKSESLMVLSGLYVSDIIQGPIDYVLRV